MASFSPTPPRTAKAIFEDFKARRSGLLRALTSDVDEFYSRCDPEAENLCLFGHPNDSWEVGLPTEEVPPELPEPTLGINFARDGMARKDWISLIAVHSDSWLLSVAFYYGARLDRYERNHLFSLINDLPTLFEVVSGVKPIKDKPRVDTGSKSKNSTKKPMRGPPRSNSKLVKERYEEDEDDEHGETYCPSCGVGYDPNKFWIGCDFCELWYHGKCVKITPAKAQTMEQFKCPSCNTMKGRQYQ